MNTISLILNNQPLKELMRDFYILTGIKIVIFDSEYQEILSYPDSHCSFCSLMHSTEATRKKCIRSNENSFQKCKKTARLEVYHCHAGLLEATAPLIDNGIVIGYIMFGQISDLESGVETEKHLKSVMTAYGLSVPDGMDMSHQITRKNPEQILAAAKILEACTFYVLLKDMISLHRQNFMKNLNAFLMEHLSEDLSIERLMKEFHVSRNKLYESTATYLGTGIAEHIKSLRIDEAKRLLKETDLKIMQISDMVGFTDYNYFCRVFKAETGTPAKQYRKLHRQDCV
ncbi:MAG: PocR ligand-binding domain-containing protein [Eubacterium sp.]|nr:PocR ligand-binding domain-containing protein [Eubacterium sp.]